MTKVTRTLDQVLSVKRFRHEDAAIVDTSFDAALPHGLQRSAFEVDGDKISFSEGLRALADKTQVHDRVEIQGTHRNRLTHSLEVSRVGRSLGVSLGARMLHYYGLHAAPAGDAYWDVNPADIGHIVAAACLAHDLGNPPFGHDGEDAISDFFRSGPLAGRIHRMVSPRIAQQLGLHEGNAQGFRMISRTLGWRNAGGLNLTAATLAAFGKYPFPLREGSKKYGLHDADLETMAGVAAATGMIADPKGGWLRHPLASLMEAADDISYLTVDLEDAVLLGLVDVQEIFGLMRPIVGEETFALALGLDNTSRAIQLMRSRMIRSLIAGCVEIYVDIAEALDRGTLGKGSHGSGIVSHTRHAEALEKIRSFSKTRIYKSQATQAMRAVYRSAMGSALEALSSELLEVIEKGGVVDPARQTELASLPGARFTDRVPSDPDQAFPWLLDNVTLLSDRQVLDISRRAAG